MEKMFERCKLRSQPIEMIYMSEKGLVTKRTITVQDWDTYMIWGFCHLRREMRRFKRSNVLSLMPKVFKTRIMEM
ncbi:hypothetical protein CR194_03585 [Salipaludibacillus keqinensis]|jgi:hypothetical protein|uniref:WYL domain-containing protein n=1 Tax=Salipaludibacillus keqinensis TaxID=2045207 RepID=A0A323TYJ3_9BACI|nr:hypothetical protein [Salipaludibacillus keqinensis]PYZ94625.1 hypothetical protein CR194_03585 [Salipaludibacillus keqinensis]